MIMTERSEGARHPVGGSDVQAALATRSYEAAVRVFLDTALQQLQALRQQLVPGYFDRAIDLIITAEKNGGRVHLTGVGKPEHVATYIAALLNSTGTPAYFLHGTEAVHGSAGQVVRGDVVIAISNSGETDEMKETVSAVKRIGASIIGVSGQADSWLARHSDVFLFAGISNEGDPLNLPPRTSVLAEIYVLAALSVALQVCKGLTKQQYNLLHPKGRLGRLSAEEVAGH
jgi:arabinose-5-phosphate isomerase